MRCEKVLVILLAVFFVGLVSADIVSINAGGSDGIIVSSSKYLEGFFFGENEKPVIWNVFLSSDFGTNLTSENLSVTFESSDPDDDPLTNISDWRVDSSSIAVLNLPMDTLKGQGDLRDYSTYQNNATLGAGNSTRVPLFNASCAVGGCYDFDGVDDMLSGDGPIDIDNSDFTMMAWIWEDADSANSWAGPLLVGNVYQSGRLFASNRFLTHNGSAAIILSIVAPTRTWNYIVVTHDISEKNLTTYLNGVLVDNEIYVGNLVATNNQFTIGSRTQTGGGIVFDGLIDEVKVYDRALSFNQIEENYQSGLAGHNNFDLVFDETERGEIWQVAMTPNDGKVDGDTVLSNTLEIINDLPPTPQPNLYSEDGRNETTADLICEVELLDDDGDDLNVTIRWYENGTEEFFIDYNNSYSNGSIVNFTLDQSNLTLGDLWMCSVRTYDSYDYSLWGNSSVLEIIDITAPNVTIISPQPINYSTLNVTFNVSLNENGSVCLYDLDLLGNNSMDKLNETSFGYFDATLGPGFHEIWFYCNDTSGNWGMNYTNFTINNDAAIAILLSDNLSWSVRWDVVNLPVDDLDAIGNNLNSSTKYFINVSATNTLVDLYVRADGDLYTQGLDVLGLGNETFSVSLNDSTVSNVSMLVMNTSYVQIADSIGDNSTVFLKFYLDAPAGQPAGVYENQLDFRAVRAGQAP